jgi:hypothetical protein
MPDPIPHLLVCGTRTLAEEVADLAAEVPGIHVAGFVENIDRQRWRFGEQECTCAHAMDGIASRRCQAKPRGQVGATPP